MVLGCHGGFGEGPTGLAAWNPWLLLTSSASSVSPWRLGVEAESSRSNQGWVSLVTSPVLKPKSRRIRTDAPSSLSLQRRGAFRSLCPEVGCRTKAASGFRRPGAEKRGCLPRGRWGSAGGRRWRTGLTIEGGSGETGRGTGGLLSQEVGRGLWAGQTDVCGRPGAAWLVHRLAGASERSEWVTGLSGQPDVLLRVLGQLLSRASGIFYQVVFAAWAGPWSSPPSGVLVSCAGRGSGFPSPCSVLLPFCGF